MADIAWFEDLGRDDINLAEGKCANLGEMVRMGMPVRPGFAVTTEAYKKFLAETGAGEEIKRYLADFIEEPKSVAEYKQISQTIIQIIDTKQIPKSLQDNVSRAYLELCKRFGIKEVELQ